MTQESAQERSLPASARKLEKARADGKVARSPELTTTLVLGGAGLAVWSLGAAIVERMSALVQSGLRFDLKSAFEPSAMLLRLGSLSVEALWIALPLLVALLLAALAAPLLLGGWLFSWQALRFDLARIDPLAGLGRMFSAHGAAELGKAIVKVILLGSVLAALLWHYREQAANFGAADLRRSLAATANMLLASFLALVGAMAALAAVDVPLQLWRHHSGLRMSLEELKEENRESEGDPHIKSQIRARQREMARRRMMSQVATADVVITNPTHYAVALSYREGSMGAPKVVAKGSGAVALRIRQLAERHGVPRLEAPSLARALHRHVELDGEVPMALYNAVAQVLAWVFQLKQQGGVAPLAPESLPVPPELDPGAVA